MMLLWWWGDASAVNMIGTDASVGCDDDADAVDIADG